MRTELALLFLLLCGACTPPDEEPLGSDLDGDGFETPEDCDDDSEAVSPEAAERCNGIDDDCDGEADEVGALDGFMAFLDGDGDGVGGDPVLACEVIEGLSALPGDCDDGDPAVLPMATELCDGVDNDCDGLTDEAGTPDGTEWPIDRDQDGYGHPVLTGVACGPGDGFADNSTDCDDSDPSRSPGEAEVCTNDQDDDCDGTVDEADDPVTPEWHLDSDGDGYGVEDDVLSQCSPPVGYTQRGGDCDDTSGSIYPGAPDPTDEVDNDCDGEIDERGDTDGVGELSYEISSSSLDCKLVWRSTFEEIYPPLVGNYTWRAEQVYDVTSSVNAPSCAHPHENESFGWTVAFFWDRLTSDEQQAWVLEDGASMWVPMFDASLRREHQDLRLNATLNAVDGHHATFSADISMVGL